MDLGLFVYAVSVMIIGIVGFCLSTPQIKSKLQFNLKVSKE